MSLPLQHALFDETVLPPVPPPRTRIAPDVPLHEMEFAVVDVETTGGSSYVTERVIEVGIVVVRNGVPAETFESLVNPCRPIPRVITRLTGISNEMVTAAPLLITLRRKSGSYSLHGSSWRTTLRSIGVS